MPVVAGRWALIDILVAAVVADLVASWWTGCDVDSESSGGNVLITGDLSVILWLLPGGLATSQAPQPYCGPTRLPLVPFPKCFLFASATCLSQVQSCVKQIPEFLTA